MGLKGCEIQLDNPWNTYYAGQTINGQVKLTFDSAKKVRGIIIRFLGEANTEWSETKTVTTSEGKTEQETETLRGHEEYFQIQYYLLGGKNSSETELPAGTHTYPFTCALPPTLPSSFEGEFGHVRYTVKVTLDRPWKFDQDMKMAFTVISPVDLNVNPRVKEPYKLELEKSFCCFCCRSGPLSVITTVPVTGYVSGQTIPITCECDNASNVGITSVKFILRKRVTFQVNQPRAEKKQSKITISELSIGPVAGGETRTFTQQLEIPALPPTNLLNCGIISLDYDLHIECDVSGPHRNLSGNIPIILGTIPLASFKPPAPYTDVPAQIPSQQQQDQDPSLAPTQPVSPASPPSDGAGGALGWNVADSAGGQLYPNIPPPQFVETQFRAPKITGIEDSEHTTIVGDANFAPRYPTFQFNNATAPPHH
ncbi:arrestin domain-containing protein 17 [Bactrocera neohumeralis]|uniref:arrestin domain-containing protein 17 n=1 Tax=Bactrocera tryoni TaxID=59916 RepID=UPI001A95E5DA|nr:arrestin domain-containing protein 17 [Bactrocera tryoni]XP_050328850.1 arrestin domain-containing protein 17 [Bactrocera neohumeralis]